MITSIKDQRTKVQILIRDDVTFNAVLMAAITLTVTEPDSLAALCKAFPDLARETFLRLMSNGGYVSLDEWLEDVMTPGTLPETKQLEHLQSIFASSETAADQSFRQATNWPLGTDKAAGLTPEQIAAITYKVRSFGLITEDRKPELINALIACSGDLEQGIAYEPHEPYNAPVEDLVADMLADKVGPTHR